jgi:hypothetical protein
VLAHKKRILLIDSKLNHRAAERPAGGWPPEGRIVMTPWPSNYYPFSVLHIMEFTFTAAAPLVMWASENKGKTPGNRNDKNQAFPPPTATVGSISFSSSLLPLLFLLHPTKPDQPESTCISVPPRVANAESNAFAVGKTCARGCVSVRTGSDVIAGAMNANARSIAVTVTTQL